MAPAIDECSEWPESVFEIPGIGDQDARNHRSRSPESVFTFRRNRCSACSGISVQDGPEYAREKAFDMKKFLAA